MRGAMTFAVMMTIVGVVGMARGNLITNGTFDSDLSGWTYVAYPPDNSNGGVQWLSDNGGSAAIRGNYSTENGYLRQGNASHPYAAGETYTISVDLASYGGGGQPQIELVLFDVTAGQSAASLFIPAASITGTFATFSFDYAVEPSRIGNNWQLDIRSLQWGGYTGIDNVSVTAAVPEPTTAAALVGAGLFGLTIRRHRRH